MKFFVPILFLGLLAFTRLSNEFFVETAMPNGANESVSNEVEPISSPVSEYDKLAKQYQSHEMAVIFPSDKTEHNIHLVEQWVLDYQQGTPATLPVYWFGTAGPSIMLIGSHGEPQYTMDIYHCDGTSLHYTSNYVVERKYDYVFGADFSSDLHPIPIQKKMVKDSAYDWDKQTALGNPNIDEILEKTKDIDSKVSTFSRYHNNIRGSGVYMSESIMSVAIPYENHNHYKIQEVREWDGELFYVIAGYEERTNRISSDQMILSIDGTNAFLLSVVDGSWIYCYDENEKIITPRVP